LRLHLKVEAVREATEDEVGHGSCGTGFFKIEVGENHEPADPDRLLH